MAPGEGAGAGIKEEIGSVVEGGVPREVQVAADGGAAVVLGRAEAAGAACFIVFVFVDSQRER